MDLPSPFVRNCYNNQPTPELSASTPIANKENALTPNGAEIKRLREQILEIKANERRLLNENQQLKGNIRTFVRVRPVLKVDAVKGLFCTDNSVHESYQHNQLLTHWNRFGYHANEYSDGRHVGN